MEAAALVTLERGQVSTRGIVAAVMERLDRLARDLMIQEAITSRFPEARS
ncbi:MAG: hypothetical protein NTY38_07515 [Acidobacteria bacterium]|nr:hypothetical protein [Acidobacteriota bacterium]